MIDFGSGYEATWLAYRVDPATWADHGQVGAVKDITITRKADGDLQSGGFSVDGMGEFEEGYYRIAMVARQGGATQRVDVATLMCFHTNTKVSGGADTKAIEGRSVLFPAAKTRLTKGTYAPAGVDGVEYVADLLRRTCAMPVEAEGGFTLDESVVFNLGTTVLDAAWLVLEAGNHIMQVDGRGRLTVMPMPSETSLVLGEANARMVQPETSRTLDWSSVPNRYTAVDGDMFAQAINADPASVTSVASRGFYVDEVDSAPKRVNGETLDAYAQRRLRELSVVADDRAYDREWAEDVYPNSLVKFDLENAGLDGVMRVVEQSYKCGAGIVVSEKARAEVSTWQ